MSHGGPWVNRALFMASMTVAMAACGSEEPPGRMALMSAVAGPWVIPEATLAIGDTQFVEYVGGGPWVGEAGCSGGLTPGAAIVRAYLLEYFPQAYEIGGYSCRPIVGASSSMSVHGTGRALDVMIPFDGSEADNGLGDPVGNFLIENAQAIGIQYIIWDRWKWRADQPAGAKDGPYTGELPHDDHLHIELSVEASEHTQPWFADTVAPPEIEGCDPLPAEGGIIDDPSPCFRAFGSDAYWRHEQGVGYGDSLIWTNAFEHSSPSNWGRWHLAFVAAGRYTVEVYLDPAFAVANGVRYQVVASGQAAEQYLDQSTGNGWTTLGTFDFAAGAGQWVDCYDNMAVPVATDQHIAFDAVRITPAAVSQPTPDAGPGASDAGPEASDAGPEAFDAAPQASDAAHEPATGLGGDCGCTLSRRTRGSAAAAWAIPALLGALAARRGGRRRARCAAPRATRTTT